MTSHQIDNFLSFLRNCEQRYHMAEADEQEANAVTNDIHHSLELEVHSDDEVLALGLELANIRKKTPCGEGHPRGDRPGPDVGGGEPDSYQGPGAAVGRSPKGGAALGEPDLHAQEEVTAWIIFDLF